MWPRGRGQLTSQLWLLLGEPCMGEGAGVRLSGPFSHPPSHVMGSVLEVTLDNPLSKSDLGVEEGTPLGSLCSALCFSPQG